MARPAVKPPKLKNGFYIELNHFGSPGRGIKIHRDTKAEIEYTMKKYEKMRDVVYLGQMKDGKFVQEPKK